MTQEIDSRVVMETVGYPVDPVTLRPAFDNHLNLSDTDLAELYFEGLLHARDRGYQDEIDYRASYESKAPAYARDRATNLAQERTASQAVRSRREQAVQEFLGFFM